VVWGGIHGAWLALERALGRRSVLAFLPAPFQTASTFAVVLLGWVFFRAADLAAALGYLRALAGLAPAEQGAALLGGVLHQPYYLACLVTAAGVVWLAPQSWDFTRRIDAPRAAWAFGLLLIACAMLFAQTYNPFIYFIF